MGKNDEIIKLLNRNVWGTNVLLIPAVIYVIMIINDINYWKTSDTEVYYKVAWYILLVILLLVIMFSTIWHVFMFDAEKSYPLMKKIGAIDHKIMAPLFSAFVIPILNVVYIWFMYTNTSSEPCTKSADLLYVGALIFQLVGIISYVLKHYVYYPSYNRRGFYKKIQWAYSHTFFHYVSYTGVSMLLAAYYINNKNVYDVLINNN